MITITDYAQADAQPQASLTLPFELRQKARLRAQLDSGVEVGLQLERGKVLRGGDKLIADDGLVVQVLAAAESVSTVSTSSNLLLARICYHLGNRHVPLQVGDGWCRYLHDHVLDDMVTQLGGDVRFEKAAFEPESGAYHTGHNYAHSHSHN